jgi:flagellar biosynthesis/type III secretory pathway protein FliH
MSKTKEQLTEEKERFNHGHPVQVKAAQYAKDKSNDAGVQLWTENTFIVGYNEGYQDGHSDGFEAAMKIHDAVRERLEKELFPVVLHEPLLKEPRDE